LLKEIIESVIKKDRLGLSISKLKAFEKCPYFYYLRYIEKIKIDKKDYNPKFFKIGQFAHKYIDSSLKGIECKFDSTTLTNDDKEQIKSRCDLILQDKLIQKLLKCNYKTEVPFSLNFNILNNSIEVKDKYSRKADIAGYIDFLAICGNTLYIIDWKTGNVAPDKPETYEQVMLYAKAALKLFGNFKKIIVGYIYIDHNEKLLKEVTPEEIDKFIYDLIARGKKIPQSKNVEDFPPNPGTHCKWCPYGKNGNNFCKYFEN